jgi:Mg2+ and Co2+ transporter CorA
VDSFASPIAQVDSEVNLIDDQIYTTRIEDLKSFLLTIEDVRVRVSSLLRLMGSKTYVLKAFHAHRTEAMTNSSYLALGEDIHLYIGDVQDHVITMISSLKHFEGILSRAQKNCLAQLDINNDVARRRVIKFLGRVTVLTMILALLNLICGLFSTNVNANTALYAANSLKAFFLIISLEALLAVVLLFLARRCRFF